MSVWLQMSHVDKRSQEVGHAFPKWGKRHTKEERKSERAAVRALLSYFSSGMQWRAHWFLPTEVIHGMAAYIIPSILDYDTPIEPSGRRGFEGGGRDDGKKVGGKAGTHILRDERAGVLHNHTIHSSTKTKPFLPRGSLSVLNKTKHFWAMTL